MNTIAESSFVVTIGRIGKNFRGLNKLALDIISEIKYSFAHNRTVEDSVMTIKILQQIHFYILSSTYMY